VAPLEVVAGSSVQPEQPCLLNRDEVGAGVHEVLVVAELGAATVRLEDARGQVLAQWDVDPGAGEGGHQTGEVRLSEGQYLFACELAGGPPAGPRCAWSPPARAAAESSRSAGTS
jgi:hypothetical protein